MFEGSARGSVASVATVIHKEHIKQERVRGLAVSEMHRLSNDALLWEAIVHEDEQTVPVVADLRKGLRTVNSADYNAVPAMPVVQEENDRGNPLLHRAKLQAHTAFNFALVAKKVGRSEMMDV